MRMETLSTLLGRSDTLYLYSLLMGFLMLLLMGRWDIEIFSLSLCVI